MIPNYKQIDIVARKQIYEQIEILYLRFIVMLLATIIILHAFLFYIQNIVIYRIQQSKIYLVYVHSSYQALQYDNRPLHFIMHAEFTSITILLRALHVSVNKLRNQHFVPFNYLSR